MHNPEYVLENETHTILCDFVIQTDHQISAKRLDFVILFTQHLRSGRIWHKVNL